MWCVHTLRCAALRDAARTLAAVAVYGRQRLRANEGEEGAEGGGLEGNGCGFRCFGRVCGLGRGRGGSCVGRWMMRV